MEQRGTLIGELKRLARHFGLVAEIEETTTAQLRQLLAQGKVPLAYIDRAVFDLPPGRRARHSIRDARIHVVIPTRVTAASVTFHDPLPPRVTRRSVRMFEHAHRMLGSCCVVCSGPGTEPSSR
jgi:hypothetical protein